jgi:RimJ/RimL family protein N-acetyltransferase
MQLETERLILRLPAPDDVAFAGELVGDPEVVRYLGGETVPEHDWPAVVEKWIRRWEANGVGPFVVVRKEDGRAVGRAGMIVWDTRRWTQSTFADAGEFAQPELGWAFVRAAWGNGYATEAARAVLEWSTFGPLISVIHPENLASQRVAQRLGAFPAESIALYDTGPAVVWRYPS